MKKKFNRGGFTLIELLVCGLILSLAAIGILNLVRMSDATAVRGRLDSRAALVFREAVDQISSHPFEAFVTLVEDAPTVGPNGAVFVYGESPGEFPFYGEDPGDPKYLLFGKPLPGETEATGMYPYVLRVEAQEDASGLFFTVRITLVWEAFRDRLVDGTFVPSTRSIFLEFQKWDAASS